MEWVCGFGQGHREPDPVPVPVRTKSPEDPKQMQRKRTGPKAPWLDASWPSQWLWFGRCQQRERERERERGPPRPAVGRGLRYPTRKRTGPGAPRAAPPRGNPGKLRGDLDA